MNALPSSLRRRLLGTLPALAVAGLLGAAAPAWAQADYPNRPIRLLVGYSAGGGVDGAARLLANQLSQQLGQPVVVENRAGASGQIAADTVAKAAPDGYTLLLGESALMIARAMLPAQSVDPMAYTPVAGAFVSPLVIIASNDFPARTPAELVKALKGNPGKLTYATSGVGTVHHLGFEMLKQETGTFVLHVPYRGAAQIVPDVISGQVSLGVVSVTAAVAQAKAGRVRALALMSKEPMAGAENVRPLADAVPGFDVAPRLFVLAPANTPEPIAARLSAAVKAALEQPEAAKAAQAQGTLRAFLDPQQLRQAMQEEDKRWSRLVRERKLTPEGGS